MKVQEWANIASTTLSEQAVRDLYEGTIDRHRIGAYHYPAGAVFNGSMREAICYVLKGECEYTFDGAVRLRSGQVANLPEGPYQLKVLGQTELKLVLAWKLPEGFR
jgi:hypothetical protein